MRDERVIRQYRNALAWAVKTPCNCVATGHSFECMMGGKMMQDAINTLDWVLGDNDLIGDRVEVIVDAMLKG